MKLHEELKSIFQDLDVNTTILTPNRRLSATLHKLYLEYQKSLDKSHWHTPDILPISSWIERLWNDYTATSFDTHPYVMNAAQDSFLWEQVLTQAEEHALLLQVSATANIAKSAWGLLQQWQVKISHPIFQCADDYNALRHWAEAFQQTCAEHCWIDQSSLAGWVLEKVKSGDIVIKRKILLFGFTELAPVLNVLLEEALSCHTISLTPMNSQPPQRLVLPDADHEILTMARWAKAQLAKDITAKIGCIIPSLDKIRDRVEQVFAEVFADQHHYKVDSQNALFNISAGKKLSQYPLIYTALQLLSLQQQNIPVETLNYLLASPFLGNAESERIKRANFDAALRQGNFNKVDLNKILIETEDSKQLSLTKSCPQLASRLKSFLLAISDYKGQHSYTEWANHFTQLLTLLGWPGERSLISEEYQVVDAWLTLLNEYISLDQVSKPVTYYEARQTLEKLATQTTFQAKTPDAPIQVLGVLEGAGMPFDAVWIAGLDDLAWPPQPKPNPFIPKSLQRELNMPHATAERELAYCQNMLSQFINSSQHVIFSNAEKDAAIELQPSPLIRHIKEINFAELSLPNYQAPSERIYLSQHVESLTDEKAPELGINEKIRGGVSVIKQQALCPFKAFAEWRLHARELESPLPGLRPKDRGNIVHKALENIWNQLQDHATLMATDDEVLSQIISECAEQALSLPSNSRSDYPQYISLEKKRLHKLLWDWLAIEKTREPFKVLMNEKATQITLNNLQLTVRIDRIDELADGKKLIIDYKTSKTSNVNHWFTERPEEPQLPMYLLLDPNHTAGITFAQVHPGETCFKGVGQYALEMDGMKTIPEIRKATAGSWNDQITHWQTVLTTLSNNFHAGIASVDPKEPPQTCEWCALKPLCRVNEECHPTTAELQGGIL